MHPEVVEIEQILWETTLWKQLLTGDLQNLSALRGTSPPHPVPCFWLDLAKNSGKSFFQSILNHLEQA
jgi:hypothetical protein